jgi:hypothetical protein
MRIFTGFLRFQPIFLHHIAIHLPRIRETFFPQENIAMDLFWCVLFAILFGLLVGMVSGCNSLASKN